jgi:hypothetical protein
MDTLTPEGLSYRIHARNSSTIAGVPLLCDNYVFPPIAILRLT